MEINSFSSCYTLNDLDRRGRGIGSEPIFIKLFHINTSGVLPKWSVHKGQASRHREAFARHFDFVALFWNDDHVDF